ncbi:ABC transporter ATP-binding protein [Micromonospora noduli]|uniref:Lipoprotein-releasing system ATP-binding protein LolD n=1 Tax=Micromonospora noduli TaxID=709876 RepID=A0A328NBD7_9ACTN|nr:ABC transporter ATP-binding protein [Micromonospora noduli]KAB1928061.1 ABC transporter ATP-binding protein [Micromonospora noduli]RAO02296.1 Lipoprotein-releasing system ATP-binding protein LolD [Micromonospora noduli]
MLDLVDVSRSYDDGHLIEALRPTTLAINDGEYIAITGPSGSGKSTLLNLLGMIDRPTSGLYRISGIDTTSLTDTARGAIRGQIFGFVFQAFHLLPGRSAVENVELGMLYGPHSRRGRRSRAYEALERVGLADRRDSDPRTMSGGERQRVAIARAVAGRPRVLFCDEPTGNLDSANTRKVLGLLQELNASGLTVVVVTHDADVAAAAPRRLMLSDGTVTEG